MARWRSLVPLLAAVLPAPAAAQLSTFSVHQRIVIRMPAPPPPGAVIVPPRWRETKGPRCVPLETIAGAATVDPERLDLLLDDGTRLRARLGSACLALDFYRGLYVKANADGQICARRDALRSRSGDACRIEAFRRLKRKR